MNQLAPIVLFTYNRPIHTQNVLNSLALCEEAKESILYVFCDGAKENTDEIGLNKIQEVRNIVNSENRFKEVIVTIHEKNKGLANSIIDGVTEIVNKFEKIIVLEDDLLVSKGFLKYMNQSLEMYQNEPKVGCIHAWNYYFKNTEETESTFFLKGADCWGWATWKRSWELFNPDASYLLNQIVSKNQEFEFNRKNTHQFVQMLKDQIEGKINSWAIRWHASLFCNNKFCLHPTNSLVKNIGFDDLGTHTINFDLEQKPIDEIKLTKIKIEESDWFFVKYMEQNAKKSFRKKNSFKNIKLKIKSIFKKKRNKGMWQGDYHSWDEAQSKTTGYDSEIILEKCKNALLKVKNGEAVYERDSVIFDKIQYSWALLCCLQKVAIENNNNLYIIDFGGSLGSTYYQNIKSLQSLNNIKWCIIEQSHFVSCGKQYFEDENLFFQENFPQALNKITPNVLLLSSVLQYLEDPKHWIKYISELKIPYIIIDRTAITHYYRDIITVQNVKEEIYQASYPCWFFNENELLNLFDNYELIFEFDSFCDSPLTINYQTEVFWKGYLLKLK